MIRKLIVCLLLLAIFAFAQDAKPNVSGTWKLNVAKSEFGPMPAPDSRTDTIDHKDPVLKNSVKAVTQQGDMNLEFTYSTDGKETKNEIMGNEAVSTAKWEGKVLVIKTKVSFNGNDMEINSRYSLSDDGKTLTNAQHMAGGMGEADQKLIFEKQ